MPKVLIVDDSAQTLQTLTFLLTPAGYQCFAAKTPIEARSAFIMERPDLAILDHGLPGEDGATLAATLKRLGNIKILMLTGRATLENTRWICCSTSRKNLKPFSMPLQPY